jgi:putative ABC transport system substrate-binding protein
MLGIRRREFITLLGGAAVWPLAARAQQGNRVRRVGVLMPSDENDPVVKTYVSAFTQALAGLGWADPRNVRMDLRWGGDINQIRAFAQELVGLQPDIILVASIAAIAALQRETRTIPVVFANAADPVASGIVPRLDRPNGNITGFASSKPRWEASGLSCSRRSRPDSSEPLSCSIPTCPPQPLICPHLRRRLRRSRSCQSLRPFIAT